jgi:MFS family permease
VDAYKRYLLAVLSLVLAFNAVDRLALGLLMQDIKLDLHLSDTQLGLVTGIAFALFYSIMGIPIARWADRGNRITIITVTTALWSAAVALCGVAGNFLQLLVIRAGVGVGEAGCTPPAHSLIADHFSRAERPRAMALYMLGAPLSVTVGYFLAGWLNEFYGWRMTFILLGLPGVLLAALVGLTLREPRRTRLSSGKCIPPEVPYAVNEIWRRLWGNFTFRHLLLCFSVMSFFGHGVGQWQAVFFIRTYGLETGELGTWFTLIFGVSGFVGTYLGGALASRHAANNENLQLKALAVLFAVFTIISALVYLSPNYLIAFGLLGLSAFGATMITAPLFATIQSLVPDHMRAVSIAIIYLFANLIGMGLGPLVAGMLSDSLVPFTGEESLRFALIALCPGYLWCSWHLWRASQTVARDLYALQSQNSDSGLSQV